MFTFSDRAGDPGWRVKALAPAFGHWRQPAGSFQQVLGGDAVEAIKPWLEAAVIGVDVVDVEVRRPREPANRRGHSVEGNAGSAGEGGQRLAAIADEMILAGATTPVSTAAIEALSSCGRTASKVAPFRSRATETGMLS